MRHFVSSSSQEAVSQMIEWGTVTPRTQVAKFLSESGLILLLCASILAPNIVLNPTWPYLRTETLMLVGYVALYGWLLLAGLAKPFRLNAFYGIGLLFCVSVTISIIFGTAILNHELSFRDLYEIPKCWIPVLFFAFAYEAELSEKGLTRLLSYFGGAVVLVCLYGWAQFLRLGIADRLNPYYTDFGHNYGALVKYNRILATMANPNALGQLMSWSLCVYVLAFLFDVGNRIRNLLIALMCAITVALTGSRYGLLASALGLLIIMGFSVSAKRRGVKLVGLILVIAIAAPLFMNAAKSSYFAARRFEQLKNPLQIGSLRGRLDVLWIDAGEYFLDSPWVGHGPAKKIFGEVFTDSEFLDILKFYGAMGFLVYLGYYVWPLMQITAALNKAPLIEHQLEGRLKANVLTLRAGFVLFCLALFMNIGEFTFFNAYLVAFLWIWGGLAVRAGHFLAEVAAQLNEENLEADSQFAPERALSPTSFPLVSGNGRFTTP